MKEETEMKNKVQTLTIQNKDMQKKIDAVDNRIEEKLKGMEKKKLHTCIVYSLSSLPDIYLVLLTPAPDWESIRLLDVWI